MASVDTTGDSPTIAMPSPKAYRRPRRRPAHLRTKTGCLTCRRRKKKCDEHRSRCNNCTKQNVECLWTSNDPRQPRSHSPPADLSEYSDSAGTITSNSPHSIAEASPSTSSPAAGLAANHRSPDEEESEDWTNSKGKALCNLSERRSVQSDGIPFSGFDVSFSYSPAITSESGHLFDFLKRKFLPELIRPAAYTHLIDTLSRETMILALNRPHCMHALLACCGAEIPTHDQRIRKLAGFHYTRAVEGLRKNLNDQNIHSQWVVTMLTVMMLCIYERANPNGSTGVEVHLSGAARMIQLGAQRYAREPPKSEIEHAMHRLAQESFIFHVATSLPFQNNYSNQREIDIAFQLAENAVCPDFHREDLFYSNSPVLGFPPKLFRCIYMTYRLHQQYRSKTVDLEACYDLDRDLQLWTHQIKTIECESEDISEGTQAIEKPILTLERPGKPVSSSTLFLGQRLYILGCQILLYRMSSGDTRSESKFQGLVEEAIEAVRALQPGYDYFAEYYCWPLLAIGMNLERQTDRELLMSKARAFWGATNNGTMKRLVGILDLYWESLGTWDLTPIGKYGVGQVNIAYDARLLEC